MRRFRCRWIEHVFVEYPGHRTASSDVAHTRTGSILRRAARACGGIGRRARLRALSGVCRVGVRVSLGALRTSLVVRLCSYKERLVRSGELISKEDLERWHERG